MVEKTITGVKMPNINIDLNDLKSLLGKDYSIKEIKIYLQKLGIEVEEIITDGLKLEVPHNRPDLFGVEGIARSLKGVMGIETGMPDYEIKRSNIDTIVDPSVKETRPIILAGIIENIYFTKESLKALMDIQEKLHQVLGFDRSKISIGAYDLDKVYPPIRYTTVKPNEIKFTPLEFDEELTPEEILKRHPKGIDYAHLIQDFDRYPLLLDSKDQVLSMPPIINSEYTRVTPKTKSLIIDVTGINENAAEQALKVIMSAEGERGFELRSVRIKRKNNKFWTPKLGKSKRKLSISNANNMLGLNLSPESASKLMERMRYKTEGFNEDYISVIVPFYRFDIMHEVDLIEDLAIGYGYDNLKPKLPPIMTSGETHSIEETSQKTRMALTGLGFNEVMTFMLTSSELNFDKMRNKGESTEILNPISEEYSILRTWLIPGLMKVLQENRQHELPQYIFEVGDVVLLDNDFETGAKNIRRTAGVTIGSDASFTYIKSVAESVLRELNKSWRVKHLKHPSFLEGRTAKIIEDEKQIGLIGEIHPEVILNFQLEHPVAGFEIDLSR